MRMELACDPEDGTRIIRLPALAGWRQGRARSAVSRLAWHDDTDHALSSDGRILVEQRGAWSVELLHPGQRAWLPATPPPTLAQAPARADLPETTSTETAAIARFEGQDTHLVLQVDGQAIALTVRRGILHAGAGARAACRIFLDGPDDAVLRVALAVAETLRVAVPLAGLAAEAVALASSAPPPPRRTGAPVLPIDTDDVATVPGAFRHTLGHLTDVLLHHAPFVLAGTHDTEHVHQMRVAVRRARSAIGLFRVTLGHAMLDRAGHGLKELGARLGPSRDWDVFVTETAPAVRETFPEDARLTRLLHAAERRRHDCHAELRAYLGSADFRLLGIELAWLGASTGWVRAHHHHITTPEELAGFAAGVMQRRLRKLLGAGKKIRGLDIPALHALRLRAKRARYAAEVFVPLYPGKAADRFIRRLSRLQGALGVLNDSAVAADLMSELGGPGGRHAYAVGVVQGFMAARATMVRPAILAAWEKFRRVAPFWA